MYFLMELVCNISYFYGCSNVGEGCWRKMAVLMLVKDVGETCMLVKTYFFSRGYFSPTYFTNIHLNFCSKCSPTYRKFFTNILHQHTFNFLFKFFTNIQFFSPTYRKLFANILHKHTYKFLSSPTYSFTNIQKILHQHTFFRQHISPTSLQSFRFKQYEPL